MSKIIHDPMNIFYVRGMRDNFTNVVIPPNTTKVVHTIGKLTSLKGVENFPPSVVELSVSHNYISSISGIEKTNITALNIAGNNLETLEDIAYSKIEILKVKGNPCEEEFKNYGSSISNIKEKYQNDGFDTKYCDE